MLGWLLSASFSLIGNLFMYLANNSFTVLFVYFPIATCLVIMAVSIDVLRWSTIVEKDCRRGRNHTARVIGWHVHDEPFRETGKIPGFIYPIVAYRRSDGTWFKGVGDKPCIKKRGSSIKIRMCPDGVPRDVNAGTRVFWAGVIGIAFSLIAGSVILSIGAPLLKM